jgi:hypothetical protein
MPPESPNNPYGQPVSPQPTVEPPSSPQSLTPPPTFSNQPASVQPPRKSRKKRWLLVAIIALVILLGGSAAAYFGYYLPNQPDQVWKKAMSNSATGYDKLVEYYETGGSDSQKGSIKGNYKIEESGSVIDGSMETKFDAVNSTTKLDAGFSGVRLNAEVLTNVPEGSKYPDVYAKVSGLKGIDGVLGGEAGGMGAFLSELDGQWYVVDHTFFDQMSGATDNLDNSSPASAPSKEDVKAVAEAFGRVNREYIFTDNPNKAVIVRKQDVGKEKLGDRDTYHYKVSYNKENLKAYANALKDALKDTKLKDYLKDSDFDQLTSAIEGLSGQGEADAWVDMETKLIRQVRFPDSENQGSYVDVALNYNGGSEYPFVTTWVSGEENNQGKTTIGVTLNTETDEIKFSVNGEGEENGKPLKFNLDATMTPTDEAVEFKKPENTKSLLEVFGGLMGAETLSDPESPLSEINEL